jgi:hypothetical protein
MTSKNIEPAGNGGLVEPTSSVKRSVRSNSTTSAPPPGQSLTGKQEHCPFNPLLHHARKQLTRKHADLKRELVSEQVKWEISELNSPTALQRFGAPFRSEFGEVSPLDSELPILRYIFVHHVREFPFLDKAKEKEFWQDKLQVVSYRPPFATPQTDVGLTITLFGTIVPRVVCQEEHLVFRG